MFVKKTQKQIINKTKTTLESFNTRSEYVGEYVEDNISSSVDSKLTTTISKTDLKDMMASPEDYNVDLRNLLTYYYFTNPDIYQYYSLMKTLPPLNYRIQNVDNSKPIDEKQDAEIRRLLNKVKYKSLSRDLISESLIGGCVFIWLGGKKALYPYIFSDFDFCFPSHRLNGDWVCVLDLDYVKQMQSAREKEIFFANFKGVITEAQYKKYENNPSDETVRYIELPQDKTIYISGDKIRRNQSVSLPFGTQALGSLMHKELLTNVEASVGNKAIKNLGVLTLGNDEVPYIEIDKGVKQAIIKGVSNAFKNSTDVNSEKIPLVSLPNFAELKFPKIEGLSDLNNDKFKETDKDINKATGIPDLSEGNYSSAKINLDLLYKKIAVILENIEEVFNKMLILLLGSKGENIYFEFMKTQPLSTKEEIDVLLKLQSLGYSTKAIVDYISSISYTELIAQSLNEIETLKLRERIIPPQTSYTLTGEEETKPQEDSPTNENTVQSKDNDSNEIPRANV